VRKVNAHLEMTVDGVVEHPETWADQLGVSIQEFFTPEMMEDVQSAMSDTGTVLLGRRTYEQFTAAWQPRGDADPFARFLNAATKLVASNSSPPLPWGPAEVLSGDVPAAVARLKEQDGGDVIVLGSVTLVGSLLRAGVLDQLELNIFPMVIGSGQRLFDSPSPLRLELTESRMFGNGVIRVRYSKHP